MALGDVAAKIGLPVFPCGSNKRPVVETGFKAATSDPAAIMTMFARPGAELIGMPTGKISGLVAVDIDIRPNHTGMSWLDENRYALPETRTHKTRSGGLHLLFRVPEGVEIRNSASRLAPGVDVRGEGGYIILPPSPGYVVADGTEPADMPLWLIRACLPPEPAPAPPPPPPRQATRHGGTPYGLAALDAECNAVSRAPFGRQEPTLNEAGLKIGALIAGGELEEGLAVTELLTAARFIASEPGREPWTPAEVEKKLRRAVADGKARPRQAPPRATPFWDQDAPPPEPDGYWNGVDAEAPSGDPITEPPEDKAPPTSTIPFLYWDDITPNLDAADFVEGLLLEGAMSVVYGQSNSGKTFWAADLALHIVSGRSWNGREIEQGAVIWLAMEGAFGISNRIAAWRRENGMEDCHFPLAVVPVALNLLHPDGDTGPLIAAIHAAAERLGMPVRLIVVDTLSRAIAGGNENAPDDMGALVTNGTKIQQKVKAHVLWIHHSGKDEAKGARGHSLLRAATDTEIEITAEGPHRVARVTKQRELDCSGEFAFTLRVVELGTNRRGKPVTSCVVDYSNGEVRPRPRMRLEGHQKRAFDVLVDAIATNGRTGDAWVPSGYPSVPEKWWRDRFYDMAMPGAEQDTKKKTFGRASADLVNAKVVGMAGGRVWVVMAQQENETDA